MPKLSTHEVAWLAAQVGFTTKPQSGLWTGVTATEIETYVAVCCAESGLDPEAIGKASTDGNWDHGLSQESGKWQWDKIQAEGGRWRDPLANTRIGYKVYTAAGRLFSPWSTAKSPDGVAAPAYVKWLPAAKLGAAHPWPYVDPLQALMAERDQAVANGAAFQQQAADALAKLASTQGQLATQAANILDLRQQRDAAEARLAKIAADLA